MLKRLFRSHFEWAVLLTGLVLMGIMNPYVNSGFSFCLFEMFSIPFCPGEGLGHSIAFLVRGDVDNALRAHPLGPAAILIILGRIGHLWGTMNVRSLNFNQKDEVSNG